MKFFSALDKWLAFEFKNKVLICIIVAMFAWNMSIEYRIFTLNDDMYWVQSNIEILESSFQDGLGEAKSDIEDLSSQATNAHDTAVQALDTAEEAQDIAERALNMAQLRNLRF